MSPVCRLYTFAFILDVEKAFDCVCYKRLLHKFLEILLSDPYVHLIASFLRDKTFCVRIDGALSWERITITAEDQQSNVLKPLISWSTLTTYRSYRTFKC